ncbi:ATP-binding protein [Streptomyces sp. NPDC091272]|uniref:ATP-binding protein n=1 Tax=Streptomyces sp. NPDC091272 TaxID=3365981 RepID=UPI0038304C05
MPTASPDAGADPAVPTSLLPPVTHSWSTECALTPRAVALARSFARTHLTVLGWAGDVDTAVLVVSELVTNAVRHARVPGRVGWLRLAVLADGGLLVDVSDPVAGFLRGGGIDVPPGAWDEYGRGLHLVREVGQLSWFPRDGVGANGQDGKTVRVRMWCPARPAADSEQSGGAMAKHKGEPDDKPWTPPPDPPSPDGSRPK